MADGALDELYFSLGLNTKGLEDDAKASREKLENILSQVEIKKLGLSDDAIKSLQERLNSENFSVKASVSGIDTNSMVEAMRNVAQIAENIKPIGSGGDFNGVINALRNERKAFSDFQASRNASNNRNGDQSLWDEYQKAKDVLDSYVNGTAKVEDANEKLESSQSRLSTRISYYASRISATFTNLSQNIMQAINKMILSIESVAQNSTIAEILNKMASVSSKVVSSNSSSSTKSKEDAELAQREKAYAKIQDKIIEIDRLKSKLSKTPIFQSDSGMNDAEDKLSGVILMLDQMRARLHSVAKETASMDFLKGFNGQSWLQTKDAVSTSISEQKKANAVARTAEAQAKVNAQLESEKALRERNAEAADEERENQEKFNAELALADEKLKGTSSTVSSLKNLIIQAFSIYAIRNFVMGLVEIGGEFEKTHIALRSIMGDIHEADLLFGRLKTLSVKSPFEFKDLSNYARQLAAFQIPNDELYDTTKRLSDISAGLNVDMGRIILAFGQVRSASVLRGQELRQFTEAGIPMVDALAKKFTELEGAEVSAAQVFERISKRQVSFQMVKDILFGMTEQGGKFFEMQETLSDTVAGKWANLKDAYAIMQHELETSVNGPLKSSIDLITQLLSNYQNVAAVLAVPLSTWGLGKLSLTILGLVQGFGALGKAVKSGVTAGVFLEAERNFVKTSIAAGTMTSATGKARLAVDALAKSFGKIGTMGWIGIIAGAITGIVAAVKLWNTENDKLEKSIDSINSKYQSAEASASANANILLTRLKKAQKSSDEYGSIIKEINNTYGSYLGNILKEAEAYDNVALAVDKAKKAIIEKNRYTRQEEIVNAINENYAERIGEANNNLMDKLKSAYKDNAKQVFDAIQAAISSGEGMSANSLSKIVDDSMKGVIDGFKLNVKGITSSNISSRNTSINEYDKINIEEEIQKILDIRNQQEAEIERRLGSEYNIRKKIADATEKQVEDNRQWVKDVKSIQEFISKSGATTSIDFSIGEGEDFLTYWTRVAIAYKDVVSGFDAKQISSQIELMDESDRKAAEKYLNDLRPYLLKIYEERNLSSLVEDKKSTSSSSKAKDKLKDDLDEQLRVMKEAYQEYTTLQKLIGREKANERLDNSGLFGNVFKNRDFNGLESYKKALSDMMNDAERILDSNERKEMKTKILKILFGFDTSETKEQIEDFFDKAAESLKTAQEKWENYKSIASATGNEQLAAQLIFGGLAPKDYVRYLTDLFDKTMQEAGNNFTFAGLMRNGVEGVPDDVQKMFENIRDIIRNYTQSERKDLEDIISKWKTSADRIEQIRYNLSEKLRVIRESELDDATKTANSEKAVAEAMWAQMKETPDFVNLTNYAAGMSLKDGEAVASMAIYTLNDAFKAGVISAQEYNSEIEKVREQLNVMSNLDGVSDKTLKLFDDYDKRLIDVYKDRKAVADTNYEAALAIGNDEAANSYMEQSRRIDQLIKDLERLEIASKNLKRIGDRIKKFAEIVGNLSEAIGTISGDSMFSDISNSIVQFASSVGDIVAGAASITTNPLQALSGITEGITGIVSSVEGLSSALYASYEKEYQAIINNNNALMETYSSVIEYKKELLSLGNYDTESLVSDTSKLLNLRVETARNNALEILGKQEKAFLSKGHSLAYEINRGGEYKGSDGTQEFKLAWNDALDSMSESIGVTLSSVKDIFSLTRDQIQTLRVNYSNYFAELGDDVRNALESYMESLEELETFEAQGKYDTVLLDDFESFKDEMLKILEDLDSGVADITDDIEERLKNLAISQMLNSQFSDRLENFRELAGNLAMSENQLTTEEANQIREEGQKLAQEMIDARNNIVKMFGFDESISDGLSSSIQGITEDTADLLASYMNAIRGDVMSMRVLNDESRDLYMNFLSSLAPELNVIARSQLEKLDTIAESTRRNAYAAESINDILSSVAMGHSQFSVR